MLYNYSLGGDLMENVVVRGRYLKRRNDLVDSFFELSYTNTHLLYLAMYKAQQEDKLEIVISEQELREELIYVPNYRFNECIYEFAATITETEFYVRDYDTKYSIIKLIEKSQYNKKDKKLTVVFKPQIKEYLFDLKENNYTLLDIDILKNKKKGQKINKSNFEIKGLEYFKSRYDYFNEETLYITIKKEFFMSRLLPFNNTDKVKKAFLEGTGQREALLSALNLLMPDSHPYLWAAFRKNYLLNILNYINDNSGLQVEYKPMRQSLQVNAIMVKIQSDDYYTDNSKGRKFNDEEEIFMKMAEREFTTVVRHPKDE